MGHIDDDTGEYRPAEDADSRFFLPSPPAVCVEFGALSHLGKVRSNNEDHFLILRNRRSLDVLATNVPDGQLPPQADQDAYLMGVADGMGGAAFGELASMQALRTAVDLLLRDIKWTMKFNERETRELIEKVGVYIQLIDRALLERARNEPRLAGMGTTLTAAYTVGPEAFIVHVGDSRAYLYRDGDLRLLTRDHTLAQQLIDSGIAAPGSAEARGVGHVLTNYLGGFEGGGSAEVQHVRLADGDRLLICSDGLTDLVDDAAIARAIGSHPEPAAACRALVDLALDRGGEDNVTVVLARYAIAPPPGDPDTRE